MLIIRDQAKSEGYKRSRNTRVFAVAVSDNEAGEDALEWLMSELVEDGDEIVAIRVIELDEDGQSPHLYCGRPPDPRRTTRPATAGRLQGTSARAAADGPRQEQRGGGAQSMSFHKSSASTSG